MGVLETPIYFDALAMAVLVGGILLLGGFVWLILDRREFEDPLRRRERQARERGSHRAGEPRDARVQRDAAEDGGPHREGPPSDGRRGRRRAA